MKKTILATICFALTACSSGTTTTSTSTGTAQASSSAQSAAATAPTTAPAAAPPAPITTTGLLKGTAKPNFPAGTAGKIDVVAVGPLNPSQAGDATLPIAIRNNTNDGVSHMEITGSARTPAGQLIANGNSQGTTPATLKPGQVGLAFIYFPIGGKIPPANAKYTFTAQGTPPSTDSYASADIKVVEAEPSGRQIVGTAKNTNGKTLQGPYEVDVYCFNTAGKLLSEHGSFASPDGPLTPNGSVSFSIDLFDQPCPTFLVGSTAYFN